MSTPEQPPPWPGSPAGQPADPPPPGSAPPPAYSAPPPGYGGPPGSPPPQPERGTNRSAIASLILGILTPCAGIPGVLAVIFGIVALVQIKESGQKGTGLAIGGIAATVVWLLIGGVIGLAVALYNSSPDRDDREQITSNGSISVNDLATGDCLGNLPDGDRILTIDGVPCSEPHDAQVYATFDLADGDWPGEDTVLTEADNGCVDRLAEFPEAYDDTSVEIFYLFPTQATWRQGDREIVCIAEYLDGTRTGSLLD